MQSKKKIVCGELCVSAEDNAASDILPCNHHIFDSFTNHLPLFQLFMSAHYNDYPQLRRDFVTTFSFF